LSDYLAEAAVNVFFIPSWAANSDEIFRVDSGLGVEETFVDSLSRVSGSLTFSNDSNTHPSSNVVVRSSMIMAVA
jgi:hypothetical protein